MKFHYSELDQFLSCPSAYKRRYIDDIRDTEESSALHCGTALHLAIKEHFEGGNAEEIFTLYWDSLKEVDMVYYRHGWKDLRDLGIRWLGLFTRLHAKKFTEFKMEEMIQAPLFTHDKYGEIIIEGTFDMCGLYEGVLTMTDWKTSTNAYKENKIIKNPQMYLYAHMYRHNYGRLPEVIQYKTFCKGTGGIQTLQKQLTEENLAVQLENCRSIIKLMLHAKENNLYPHTFDCFCKENT
jgi:hypothetical protein